MTWQEEWIKAAPRHWTRGRIKNLIATSTNGTWGEDPSEHGGAVKCIRATDFNRQQRRVNIESAPLRKIGPADLARHRLNKNDLIIEKSGGGEKQPVGMVALYDSRETAVCSNFCARIVPAAGVSPKYLNYVFQAGYSQGLTSSSIKQTTGIQNLDTNALYSNLWAYPAIEEQRRIADFLDAETARIDRITAPRAAQVELLEAREKIATEDAFKSCNSAKRIRLKYLLSCKPRYGVLVPSFTDDGVPFIRVNNLTDLAGRIDALAKIPYELSNQYRRTITRPRDLLLSVVGTMGRAAVVPPELAGANVARAVASLRPSPGINPHLLAAWMSTPDFHRQAFEATGSDTAQPTLGMEDLANFSLHWPLDEQELGELSNKLNEVKRAHTSVRFLLNRQLELLAERRQALITAAVTGQFDVSTASGRGVTE